MLQSVFQSKILPVRRRIITGCALLVACATSSPATVFGPDSLSKAPDPTTLETGDLESAMGKQPGTVVVIDPATGASVGDPIPVGAAGPTSVVVE